MSHPMMWIFALLVVAAMGGVAMLAAGYGQPMEPAYDDRPDALVPRDHPIGADDLRRVRFPLALRGYRMAEVDALLARLAAEMEATRRVPDEPRAGGLVPPGERAPAEDGRDDATST